MTISGKTNIETTPYDAITTVATDKVFTANPFMPLVFRSVQGNCDSGFILNQGFKSNAKPYVYQRVIFGCSLQNGLNLNLGHSHWSLQRLSTIIFLLNTGIHLVHIWVPKACKLVSSKGGDPRNIERLGRG